MDFSDSLNALVCSTDRGRIEVIAESVEKRKCDPSRPRYIPEVRLLKKIPIFFTLNLLVEILVNIYPRISLYISD